MLALAILLSLCWLRLLPGMSALQVNFAASSLVLCQLQLIRPKTRRS